MSGRPGFAAWSSRGACSTELCEGLGDGGGGGKLCGTGGILSNRAE